MYHRGNLEEFNEWQNNAHAALGYPKNGNSIYSAVIKHPANEDDYIWPYGKQRDLERTSYSVKQVKSIGFLPPDFLLTPN